MKAQKLIDSYKKEIENYATLINGCTEKIREVRRDGAESYFLSTEELANERKVYDAQMQRTIQFTKDLEDLI